MPAALAARPGQCFPQDPLGTDRSRVTYSTHLPRYSEWHSFPTTGCNVVGERRRVHLAREQILIVRLLGRPKHFYSVSYRGLSLAAIILFGHVAPLVPRYWLF